MLSTSSFGRPALTSHRKLILTAMSACAAVIAAPAPAETADAMFAQAKAQAQTDHKRILLVFSASWCGPCKLYERFLQDPQMKPITEKSLVVQRIGVGELKNDTKHANTPVGPNCARRLAASENRASRSSSSRMRTEIPSPTPTATEKHPATSAIRHYQRRSTGTSKC
jgi:thiol-disulfide isomerase/thioredoxin